ncbi:hypothetical protein KGV52_00610 [Candidatus Gracilibacteria bacterium]|nr:hypothetical protein [Candidatus Gracilibacteria bacterium]
MFTIKKVIIGLLTFFTTLTLIYSSYVYIGKGFSHLELHNKVAGKYFYTLQEDSVKEEKNGKFLFAQMNSFNSIISSNKDISITEDAIQLPQNGSYLINIASLDKQYTITGKGYKFQIDKPINILVTGNEKQTTILTFNAKLDVNLLDISDQSLATVISLYPHEYFNFKPEHNNMMKKVDISRVQQISPIRYIDDRVANNGSINQEFIQKIAKLNDEEKKNITGIFEIFSQEQIHKKQALQTFLQQKFISISGQALTQKYFSLFLNPEKKKAYYKNKILTLFSELLQKQKGNIEKDFYKNKSEIIIKNLKILAELNKKEEQELSKLLQEYLVDYLATHTKNIEKRANIYQLFYKLNDKTQSIDTENLKFYTEFFAYDMYNGENFYPIVHEYTAKISRQSQNRNDTGYLIHFLKQVLLGSFKQIQNGDLDEMDQVLGIFNTYVKKSTNYYKAEDVENPVLTGKMNQTGIKEYGLLLDEAGTSMRKTFFEEKRDDQNRLQKISDKGLSSKKIKIFEANLNALQYFYQKYNKGLKNSRINILNRTRFSNAKKYFHEYLLALSDYDKYLNLYNKKAKTFFQNKNENKQVTELDADYVKNLFKNDSEINLSRAEIISKNINYCLNPASKKEDGEPYCYQINNAYIGNRFFNFILIPNEGNTVNYIYYIPNENDKNFINAKFKIDQLKSDEINRNDKNVISNKFKSLKPEKKYSTDNNGENNLNIDDVFADEQKSHNRNDAEQELLTTVKNTLLLGRRGTFSKVRSFMEVDFNDIDIKKSEKKEQYDIYLSNVNINFNDKNNGDVKGILQSKYIFKAGSTSSFLSPKITMQGGTHELGFTEYTYELVGIIPIQDMKQHLQILGKLNKEIIKTIQLANKEIGPGKLNIKYYVKSHTFIVSYGKLVFAINGNTKLVKSMTFNRKKYLTKLVHLNKLEEHFKTLPKNIGNKPE